MGIELLFYATLLLIAESRIALKAVKYELNFVLHQSQKLAPVEFLKRPRTQIVKPFCTKKME
ncbi:hypothetical protein C7B61_06320 [filamentous cyanobacterium CCP1]|nr:hypothetical protein C7B76_10090 [filamentous cyanobacterium CCP2]PSB67410.1 hypothetical protein C7B61_06320 [filamentous cyanobacterium CCP1]